MKCMGLKEIKESVSSMSRLERNIVPSMSKMATLRICPQFSTKTLSVILNPSTTLRVNSGEESAKLKTPNET